MTGCIDRLCRLRRAREQHRDRHRLDSARDRGDPRRALARVVEIDIAAEPAILVTVDADFDDDRPWLDSVSLNETRLAHGGEDDVAVPLDQHIAEQCPFTLATVSTLSLRDLVLARRATVREH